MDGERAEEVQMSTSTHHSVDGMLDVTRKDGPDRHVFSFKQLCVKMCVHILEYLSNDVTFFCRQKKILWVVGGEGAQS